jgi:hypothetical protein
MTAQGRGATSTHLVLTAEGPDVVRFTIVIPEPDEYQQDDGKSDELTRLQSQ